MWELILKHLSILWELILKHLPTFGWILVGAVVLTGMLNGTVESAKKVLGKNIGFLDRFGCFPLGIALYSILGGIGWLALAYTGKVSGTHIFPGLLIGGLIGSVILGISLELESSDEKEASGDVGVLAGLIVGGIAGWIVGGIVGGSVDEGVGGSDSEIAGWIVGGVVGWLAGLVVGGIAGLIVSRSADKIESGIAGGVVGGIVGGVVGVFVGLIAGEIDSGIVSRIAGRIVGGVVGVFVGLIAGGIADEIVSRIAGRIVGGVVGGVVGLIAGLIAGGIAGGIFGWIAGGVVGGIVSSIAGGIDWVYDGIVGVILGAVVGAFLSVVVGEVVGGVVGGVVGSIGGVIAIGIVGAGNIIFIPFSKFLTPVLILIIFRKTVCVICFHYSMPLRSIYNYGTRYCEHCNTKIEGSTVKKVIGLIGGDVENYKVDGDKVYVNLWFEKEERARNADIDILEIRRSNNDINYAYAIAAVYIELKNDASRPPDYVKTIPVIIEDNQLKDSLSPESMDTLEYYFGGVKGVIKD